MMETTYKKPLDIPQKDCMIDKDESIKIPRDVVIEVLKTIKGLERKLQKELK